jgi:hypothetical protein
MIKTIHIGIDPGSSSGSVAWIIETNAGKIYSDCIRFSKATEKEISDKLKQIASYGGKQFCVIEKVWSMPGEGMASSTSFGENIGFIRGTVMCLNIPFDYITSQRWQKDYVTAVQGRKNLNKETKAALNYDFLPTAQKKEIEKSFKAHNLILKNEQKKKLKERAEALFPQNKIVADNADAFLLADYCRKYHP